MHSDEDDHHIAQPALIVLACGWDEANRNDRGSMEGGTAWVILGHPEAVTYMHDPSIRHRHLFQDQKLAIFYMVVRPTVRSATL
ncbi:hypothetical protein [Synechococcus sp. CS-1328]|uniref:hypothetical protein n=1 Tax=Synechococcus sp. CS-1328 TaxID=2847976 RepID=UPI00223B8720|nr:hypothetical protein [Synechococcus sp. CS-1328]MCT0224786.1 hypothetical protein [Synechococcus sp. CS-1328]